MYDEYLRPAGLTIGQYSILAALYYVPSMPLLKLAQRLELDRTTLTRTLARLERDGFVSIALDAEDNRVRSISITDTGLKKLIESYPLWQRAQQELSKTVGAAQLKEFRRSLDEAIGAMKSRG
jgi:DNA-binding MarR family transcriptional regulator